MTKREREKGKTRMGGQRIGRKSKKRKIIGREKRKEKKRVKG